MRGSSTTFPAKVLLTRDEEEATPIAARGLPTAGYRVAALYAGGLSPISRSKVRGSFA